MITNSPKKLNRRFSPINLLMLSINGMIGSAWLFAPLYAAKNAGVGAIIAWLIGGIATIIIALTFSEVAVLFPVAGGTAQIPQLSHGTFTGFVLSWLAWLSALTMTPIEVQAVLLYASTYFTSLIHLVNGIPVLTKIGIFWAVIIMLFFCIINSISFKGLIRFNLILFWFKISVILLTIGTLVKVQFHIENFSAFSSNSYSSFGWQAILSAVATSGVAFAFTGFKHGVELAGEAKHSNVAIPVAIIGSIVCCLILYIGLQIAFIGAINPENLSQGWSHLNFTGEAGPFAGLAAGLGLIWLLKILYIDATISPSGAGLIYMTSTARILYAMSEIGYLPRFLSYLNKQNFPTVSIAVNFIIGIFLFLPLPGWQSMVSFLVSGMVLSYAMGPIALLSLRLELPNQKRHFRLPAAHFLCLLAFYFCNLMNYWTGWETISKLAIAMMVGFFIFGITGIKNKKSPYNLGLKCGMWIIPYLLGLVLISYLGSFGGKMVIPFGWDFLVIGIFSIFFLYLAVLSRSKIAHIHFTSYQESLKVAAQ